MSREYRGRPGYRAAGDRSAHRGEDERGRERRDYYGEAPDDWREEQAEEQPLDDERRRMVERAYELFDEFRAGLDAEHRRQARDREIFNLHDDQARDHEPQLPILVSTIQGKVADQLDNMPEPIMTPESPEMQEMAESATDLARWVLERSDYDTEHIALATDMYVTGMAVVETGWDPDADNGQGNVRVERCPAEHLYWDPMAKKLQQSRAVFRAIFHTRKWYREHYPGEYRYIQGDEFIDPDAPRGVNADGQDSVMMLEYWRREYDGRRHRVHVAYIAGRALLYDSRESMPEGVYAHGEYPFCCCTYRDAPRTIAGRGVIDDFIEMQRYANRNAHYIDINTRMAARPRMLVSDMLEIDESELEDLNHQVIKTGAGSVDDGRLRWLTTPPLPALAMTSQQWYVDGIKQESGQNQFSRGEGGLGVTAASAIQSLQEAGAKSSRMETQRMVSMFRDMCTQVLWLIAQFFDPPRTVMITGKGDSPFEAQAITARRDMITRSDDLHPAYRVNMQIRRRNPLRVESENQLILKLYEMSAAAGRPMDVLTVLEMLQVDGKERIMPRLRAEDRRQSELASAMQAAKAGQEAAQQTQQQLNDVRRKMTGDAQVALARNPVDSVYG